MNKELLLKELQEGLTKGSITQEEILSTLHLKKEVSENKLVSHFTATKILYVIGAVIVVVGIITLISQIWESLGSLLRVLITLGLGLVLTGTGSLLLKKKSEDSEDSIGLVFQAIGGTLIPGGALVTLHELGSGIDTAWPIAITFGGVTTFYILLTRAHKNALLTFFSIANGTAFLYLFTAAIINSPFYKEEDIYAYLTMAIGISYLLLAYSFGKTGLSQMLSRALYFFGTVGFLGASFSRVFDSGMWQLFYFVILGGSILTAVYLKNRTVLILTMLFLVAHVSYITGKYFANSIGWPLVLVLLGFVFIGLGYATVRVSKKYITN